MCFVRDNIDIIVCSDCGIYSSQECDNKTIITFGNVILTKKTHEIKVSTSGVFVNNHSIFQKTQLLEFLGGVRGLNQVDTTNKNVLLLLDDTQVIRYFVDDVQCNTNYLSRTPEVRSLVKRLLKYGKRFIRNKQQTSIYIFPVSSKKSGRIPLKMKQKIKELELRNQLIENRKNIVYSSNVGNKYKQTFKLMHKLCDLMATTTRLEIMSQNDILHFGVTKRIQAKASIQQLIDQISWSL